MGWLYTPEGTVDWRWIVTALVATYAAGVATYREYVARRDKRADVRVSFVTSMVALIGNRSIPHVQITVENHGHVVTTFDSNCASIELRGRDTRLVVWTKKVTNVTSWPHQIVHGASFYLMTTADDLRESLAALNLPETHKIRAVVTDAIGRSFYSNWTKLKA